MGQASFRKRVAFDRVIINTARNSHIAGKDDFYDEMVYEMNHI